MWVLFLNETELDHGLRMYSSIVFAEVEVDKFILEGRLIIDWDFCDLGSAHHIYLQLVCSAVQVQIIKQEDAAEE